MRAGWSAQSLAVRLALLVAVAWLVLLLATLGRFLDTIYANADVAAAAVIGDLYSRAPDNAHVTLANYPWYVTLWLELLTRRLPFHRELWEVGPWVGSLAAVGMVAWATAKVAGRWAAGIVALVLVCTGKAFLFIQFAPSVRGTSIFFAALLGAFLVLLANRAGRLGGTAVHVVVSVVVAAVAAAGLASDKLLYAMGLLPFLGAGLLVARLAPRTAALRIALTTGGITVGAVVGSRIVVAEMHARRIAAAPYPVSFTTFDRLVTNALDALQSLAVLFNGDVDGMAVGLRSPLTVACAGLVVAAVVVVARFGYRWTRDAVRDLRAGSGRVPVELLPRAAHIAFWLLAAVLPLAAFLFTSAAGINNGRYLVSTAFGLVVVVAVANAGAAPSRRLLVTLGAAVLALGGLVSVARDFDPSPGNQFARDILPLVEGEGLQYGYAAYWNAMPLTWKSHLKVQVFPIVSCPRAPHGLCTYYLHTISSWYRPRPGTKTFLIVDHRYGPPPPGARLGGTKEVVDFKHYSVYVYDYDIASNIADWHRYSRLS